MKIEIKSNDLDLSVTFGALTMMRVSCNKGLLELYDGKQVLCLDFGSKQTALECLKELEDMFKGK